MTKIREFATRWDKPRPIAFFEREHEALVGSAKSTRATPKFRPFDMVREPHKPVLIWQNDLMRVGVESVAGPEPYFRRNCDYDELWFQFAGKTRAETEAGVFEMGPSEMLLVPSGIAHRSTGTPDSLRLYVQLPEAPEIMLGEDKMVSHTEFDMVRVGGPPTGSANGIPEAPKGKVLEKLSTWYDTPEETTTVERKYEHIVGSFVGGGGLQKLRAFDYFTEVTGQGGPGPVIYESPVFKAEVYNTDRPMLAFHRGLDQDEIWFQFAGDCINESEFGTFHLLPGEMNHVPPGIAHRVVGFEGFLRFVLYSRKPCKLMVDPTKHLYESHFEPKERFVQAPAYRQ